MMRIPYGWTINASDLREISNMAATSQSTHKKKMIIAKKGQHCE